MKAKAETAGQWSCSRHSAGQQSTQPPLLFKFGDSGGGSSRVQACSEKLKLYGLTCMLLRFYSPAEEEKLFPSASEELEDAVNLRSVTTDVNGSFGGFRETEAPRLVSEADKLLRCKTTMTPTHLQSQLANHHQTLYR